MKVVAYIDESGTHDKTGSQKGSSVAVIAGLVDYAECWAEFCEDWQKVLNKHSAPYFHFCELSAASLVVRGKIKRPKEFTKNPYSTWPLARIDHFLNETAELVGAGNKVIVGGWIETANIHKARKSPLAPRLAVEEPYEWMLHNFFENLPNSILSGWPNWREPVSIFFDWSSDPKWTNAAVSSFRSWKARDARFSELSFADKKQRPHLPLQAADMIAFRFRQLAENFHGNRLQADPLPALDQFMMKSMFNQFSKHGPGPIPLL